MTLREILNKYQGCGMTHQALKEISDWLESKKKDNFKYGGKDGDEEFIDKEQGWNSCIDELKKELSHDL